MVIFRFFGQNCLRLELSTFVIHRMFIKHKKEDIKWIFEEKINHNLSLSKFSKTQALWKWIVKMQSISIPAILFLLLEH